MPAVPAHIRCGACARRWTSDSCKGPWVRGNRKVKPGLRICVPKLGMSIPRLGMSIPRLGIEPAACLYHFYNEYFRSLLSVSCNSIASVCQAGNLYPVARLPFSGRSHSSFVEGSQKELGR